MKESNLGLEPIKPVLPVAPYLGGKRNLAKNLSARIVAIPHDTYVEPFIGMGGVFLRRSHKPKGEVINDLNRDVANLFRILQRHYVPLMDMLRWQVTSRDEFARLLRANPDSLTDLERAVRFLYIQRCAFGGKLQGQSFGVSIARGGRFDMTRLAPLLEDVHARMTGVTIECLPWADVIKRYDKPATLFYLDPPYWGNETDYAAPFSREQFTEMAALLSSISGRFILSLNDRPEVRDVFRQFRIEAVEVSYSLSAGSPAKHGEVIISN